MNNLLRNVFLEILLINKNKNISRINRIKY